MPIGAGMPGAGIAVGGIPCGIPPGGGPCTPAGTGMLGGIGVRGGGFCTFIKACVMASR
jgi:hypothetical protein